MGFTRSDIDASQGVLKGEKNPYFLDGEFLTPADVVAKRKQYQQSSQQAKDSGNTELAHYYSAKVGQASEHLGEAAGKSYVKTDFPGAIPFNASLAGTLRKNDQFDQIYLTNGRLLIVEAKGTGSSINNSKLSTQYDPVRDTHYAQGTTEYIPLIIKKMEKHAALLSDNVAGKAEMKKTIAALKLHSKNGTIDYHMVIQKVKKDGNLGDVTIRKY